MHWENLFKEITDNELIFFEPINQQEIRQIEEIFHVKLSGQLLELLEETNGIKDGRFGDFWVGDSSEIIELYNQHHIFLKTAGIEPPHKIFFFADNGCGECFGFRIEDGQIADGQVGVYYPIENEFRIVAPDFKTWAIEWCSGLLSS